MRCSHSNAIQYTNAYAFNETLLTSTVNQNLINPLDLQYILYDVKGQLRSQTR